MSMPSEVAIDPAGSVLSLMPMHYVGGGQLFVIERCSAIG